ATRIPPNPAGVDEVGVEGVEKILSCLQQAATHLIVQPERIQRVLLWCRSNRWRAGCIRVANPDQTVGFAGLQRQQQRRRTGLRVTARRPRAMAALIEAPAVIRTLDGTVAHATGAQRRQPVRTAVR